VAPVAKAERRADVVWTGDLIHGSGTVQVGSGALARFPVTWASRTERSDGKTSPEELIAAAHAACYAMAFSNTLAKAGHAPEQLNVSATCTLDQVDGKFTITTMDLVVRGTVPGLDQRGFEEAARTAEAGCPVSNALRNNVKINVRAQLEAAGVRG
jgi:osmotically inducible protein OsmC